MALTDTDTLHTYTTDTAPGQSAIREDLINVITNIDPVDTYVTSNTANVRAKARYHEWTTDALDSAAPNKVIEGDTWNAAAVTPPTRTGNYCQIVRKQWGISDTSNASDSVGGSFGTAYQMERHMKSLARDIEYALVVNSAEASGASGTARATNGMNGFISDNVNSATADRAITAAIMNSCLQTIWNDGGTPRVALMGGFQKITAEAWFTQSKEMTTQTGSLQAAVDVYKSSFGPIMLKLHHQINTTIPGKVLILGDMSLWQKAWLRPVQRFELSRDGGTRRFMIEAELALESRQEKGSGAIHALSTS